MDAATTAGGGVRRHRYRGVKTIPFMDVHTTGTYLAAVGASGSQYFDLGDERKGRKASTSSSVLVAAAPSTDGSSNKAATWLLTEFRAN